MSSVAYQPTPLHHQHEAVFVRRSHCRRCRWHLQVAPGHHHRPLVGCPQRRRQLPMEVGKTNIYIKLYSIEPNFLNIMSIP